MKRYLFILCLFYSSSAHAAAARPEELLCHSSYVVLAKVMSASAPDCTHDYYAGCYDTPSVPLLIKIDEIIGVYNGDPNYLPFDKLAQGNSIKITAPVYNVLPKKIAGIEMNPPDDYGSIKIRPPTGQALSDEQVAKAFVDKEFIFAIAVTKYDKPESTFHSFAWSPERSEWVQNTLKRAILYHGQPSCPKLKE